MFAETSNQRVKEDAKKLLCDYLDNWMTNRF